MSYFIDDPRKWRLSKSGFSIKTGWADGWNAARDTLLVMAAELEKLQ